MNQPGQPADPEDCSFKVCPNGLADTAFAQASLPKIDKMTLWAVTLLIVGALLFPGFRQAAGHPQRRRLHPRSIPLFYRFCTLLN